MRMSREATAESRIRIVEEAARMFRARGLAGASIAEVMAAAGMTHGGFYKHFRSKEALEEAAVSQAFQELAGRFDEHLNSSTATNAKRRYVDTYLSRRHVKHADHGCPVAALGAESSRSGAATQRAFAHGMEAMIERFIAAAPSHRKKSQAQKRADAIRELSLMVGAIVVARACGEDRLAEDALTAAKAAID